MPPLVKTRDEQVEGEMQTRDISTAAAVAQDKTEAASSRFAPAIPHADATNFAQLSSNVQPRPTPKTLMTCSSQPVSKQCPENNDRDACLNVSYDVSTFGVTSVRKFPGSKTRSPSADSG